jgi:hypothetical protein
MKYEIQATISGGREALVAELEAKLKEVKSSGNASIYVKGNGESEDNVAITFDADEMLAKDLAADGSEPLIVETKRVAA